MSGGRTIFGLLVGIAAVAGAHMALDLKTRETPHALRRHVLLSAAEKATTFSIVRAGEAETRLVRTSEGAWMVTQPFVVPAEREAVMRFLDALAFTPPSDEMSDAELLRIGRTRADFGLLNPRIVVGVGNAGKDASTTVRFGSSTPAGDGVYATVGESDTVYVVPSNVVAAVDVGASGFRRRRLLTVDPEDVASFDIHGNGKSRFVRLVREANVWKVSEPRVNAASSVRVREFLDVLLRLEARDFVWPKAATNETPVLTGAVLAGYGLSDDAAVTISLKTALGKDCTLGLGGDAGDGLVYARTADGAVVTVPATVRTLALAGEDGFVDTRLFPLQKSAINTISLVDGETPFLLSRMPNGEWRLDAPVSAEAESTAVNGLIDRLLALNASHVEPSGVRVSFGTNVVPVAISRKVLLDGLRLEDLRAKEILKIDPKQAKRIVATDGEGKPVSVLFDTGKGVWNVESATQAALPDDEAVTRLLTALAPLRATRIERLKVSDAELGKYGLDKPVRTLAVDQAATDAVRRNILIGDVTDGGRFATLGSSDAVFVIAPEQAATLLAPLVR